MTDLPIVRTLFEWDCVPMSFESTWEGRRVYVHACDDEGPRYTYGLFAFDEAIEKQLDAGTLSMYAHQQANAVAKVVVDMTTWPWTIVSSEAVTELPDDWLCTPDAEWFTRMGKTT